MTEQIAIHCLKAIICEEVCEECELYGQTGTDHCEADAVRIAIEALEKQIPKKPHKINIANTSWCKGGIRFECPACHKFLGYRELTYCGLCGQKLDLSE